MTASSDTDGEGAALRERGGLLVDWRAVWMAWLIAGTVYLVLDLVVVPAVVGGSFWISVRLVASLLLGNEVLAPPASFHGPALLAAIVALARQGQFLDVGRLYATLAQLDLDAHIKQLCSRIPQGSLIGGIGRHNTRALLMQEAGGCKSGAAETDNDHIFIF